MGRGVQTQHDALTIPTGRHEHFGLVPDIADVVADRGIGENIIVA